MLGLGMSGLGDIEILGFRDFGMLGCWDLGMWRPNAEVDF